MVRQHQAFSTGHASTESTLTMQRVVAGGVVFFVLVMFADFEPTSEAAVAFSYLILLSVLLVSGPVAFDRIAALTSTTAPGGGSAGAKKKG